MTLIDVFSFVLCFFGWLAVSFVLLSPFILSAHHTRMEEREGQL